MAVIHCACFTYKLISALIKIGFYYNHKKGGQWEMTRRSCLPGHLTRNHKLIRVETKNRKHMLPALHNSFFQINNCGYDSRSMASASGIIYIYVKPTIVSVSSIFALTSAGLVSKLALAIHLLISTRASRNSSSARSSFTRSVKVQRAFTLST